MSEHHEHNHAHGHVHTNNKKILLISFLIIGSVRDVLTYEYPPFNYCLCEA
jgi:hypothetical protein